MLQTVPTPSPALSRPRLPTSPHKLIRHGRREARGPNLNHSSARRSPTLKSVFGVGRTPHTRRLNESTHHVDIPHTRHRADKVPDCHVLNLRPVPHIGGRRLDMDTAAHG